MTEENTCEVELRVNQKPISGKGKDRVYPVCGKPAAYVWKPRRGDAMYACAEHGPQLAGNFTDELTKLP